MNEKKLRRTNEKNIYLKKKKREKISNTTENKLYLILLSL